MTALAGREAVTALLVSPLARTGIGRWLADSLSSPQRPTREASRKRSCCGPPSSGRAKWSFPIGGASSRTWRWPPMEKISRPPPPKTWFPADRNCDSAHKKPPRARARASVRLRDPLAWPVELVHRGRRRDHFTPLRPCHTLSISVFHLSLRHPLRPGVRRVVVPARGRLSPVPGTVTPPFAAMKLPTLPKVSNPIQRRPDGKLTIVGLTPMEWCTLAASLM